LVLISKILNGIFVADRYIERNAKTKNYTKKNSAPRSSIWV